MSTDIEQRVRTGLTDAPSPTGLRLDAAAVTRLASRGHRRRRNGRALVAGMASLTVLTGVGWAGGWLPDGAQRALPASPWAGCPVSGFGSGEQSLRLEAVEYSTIPLTGGGTVVTALAQGCPGGDFLVMSATPESPDALPETVPLQGAIGTDSDTEMLSSWLSGLQLLDGRRVTGGMIPGGARDLTLTGPDVAHEPTSDPVGVPGTGMSAFVLADYWPAGDYLAQVWRGGDGLVHTSWSSGATPRLWQGDDPAGALTDTWVAQDTREQQWLMRNGEVAGPFPVTTEPYAVAFPTSDPERVEVLAVLPDKIGELRLDDSQALQTQRLTSSEGEPTFNADLITLEDLTLGEPLPDLTWTTDTGDDPQRIEIVEP